MDVTESHPAFPVVGRRRLSCMNSRRRCRWRRLGGRRRSGCRARSGSALLIHAGLGRRSLEASCRPRLPKLVVRPVGLAAMACHAQRCIIGEAARLASTLPHFELVVSLPQIALSGLSHGTPQQPVPLGERGHLLE